MGKIPQNYWIRFAISLTLVIVVQGPFVQYNYKKVSNGQLFNGTLEGKYTERSKIECSLRYERNSIKYLSFLSTGGGCFNFLLRTVSKVC